MNITILEHSTVSPVRITVYAAALVILGFFLVNMLIGLFRFVTSVLQFVLGFF